MSGRRERLLQAIDEWSRLRICGPGDDPDAQTNVCLAHRYLLVEIRRLAAPLLAPMDAIDLQNLDIDLNNVYTVYDARAELNSLIPEILEAVENLGDDAAWPKQAGWIVDPAILEHLRVQKTPDFDLGLLSELCREINSSFSAGNNVAAVLLMRAVLNYVPPVFGQSSFAQVTAHSGRTLKDSFETLENGLRKIADFHTHRRIDKLDSYPSAAQVEPFKPQFELLLQEVLRRVVPG